jgi:serpin B
MKTHHTFALAIVTAIVLVSSPLRAQKTSVPNGLVSANNVFAFDLYQQLRTQDGNLFLSPYSISIALAMAYGGARGETKRQMAKTLHFSLPPDKVHPGFAALEKEINAVQQKGKVKLLLANSLWPRKKFALSSRYLALCKTYYGTSVTPLDYAGATEKSRQTINDWVESKTAKKITDLIKPGGLTPLTRLVLVNAIYFKGAWANLFDEEFTKEEPFYISEGKAVQAPLMHQQHEFGYGETLTLQILELPYAGNELSMMVLLPKKNNDLVHLEESITAGQVDQLTRQIEQRKVNVFLPKFKLDSGFSLKNALSTLGMTDAFDGTRADFSGMDGEKDLFISAVMHKAFVDVNEKGTEAAAATAVTMLGMSRGEPEESVTFKADHPFLFLIRHNETGAILFLGRVMNPTK